MVHYPEFSSLKKKLQFDSINPLYVIGAGLVLCCVLILTGQALWNAFSGSHLTFEQTSSLSSQQDQDSDQAQTDSSSSSEELEKTTTSVIYVHVSGAVITPGLYEISSGSRIFDAIEAAGGLRDDAAEESVNLAQVIEDGSHVVVLTKEESQNTSSIQSNSSSTVQSLSTSTSGLVNINTATLQELTTLKGIGEATAQKIIDDREQNGAFKSKEDLKRVAGIGDKKYEAVKAYITV